MAEPKKQVPLRLNAKLYDALAAWAEDDFRSVNGQIEYLLTECAPAQEEREICFRSDRRTAGTGPEIKQTNQPRLWKVVFHSRGRLRLCDRKT